MAFSRAAWELSLCPSGYGSSMRVICFFVGLPLAFSYLASPVPTISRTALPVVRGGKQLGEGASRLFGAKNRLQSAVFSAAGGAEAPAGDDGNLRKWDPQVWIAPAVHNKNSVRAVAIAVAVGLAIKSTSTAVSARAALFGHLLSLSTWLGSVLYTTFVLGIVAFKNLPRQTFGKLQSKLFPIYFQLSTVMLILQLATGFVLRLGRPSEIALGVALVTTLLNQFLLEPASTDIMFKRYALEDAGKRESDEWRSLGKQFGKFHGLSSLMNLAAICGGFAHLWFLAVALK